MNREYLTLLVLQNNEDAAVKASNLIVVAGHSVTTSGHLEDADQVSLPSKKTPFAQCRCQLGLILLTALHVSFDKPNQDELDWFLLPYQKSHGLPNAIVAHITAGIEAAHLDSESLLVFSGGETRPGAGPDTEGSSYFRVADAMDLWPPKSSVRSRTLAEEFARDSFENLYVATGFL